MREEIYMHNRYTPTAKSDALLGVCQITPKSMKTVIREREPSKEVKK
jgi:hypothetical protein